MQQIISFVEALRALDRNDEGQGLVEYALIIALVAVVLVGALGGLTTGIQGAFGTIVRSLG